MLVYFAIAHEASFNGKAQIMNQQYLFIFADLTNLS